MPSEHRLHPASVLFWFASQLRQFALPAVVLLVTAGSSGWGWQVWTLWLIVPNALVAIARYVSLRYRYEAGELVIRSGILFRNERHIPYARIQNLDVVQSVFHRLLHVVDVRVETGGAQEPEATLSVLPLAALDAMRQRVFGDRHAADRSEDVPAPDVPAVEVPGEARRVLLTLTPADLLLHGFIQNRGMVIVGAGIGLLWEAGLWDPVVDRVFRGTDPEEVVRYLGGGRFGQLGAPVTVVALGAATIAVGLLAVRVLSMAWSVVRLHAFRLSRVGGDLRSEFGLLTRVTATIPLGRIQSLTVREGLVHRAFGRMSLSVATAGGHGGGHASQREEIAPILARDRLGALVREVLPTLDLSSAAWQPADQRAVRRVFKRSAIAVSLLCLATVAVIGWWSLALAALLLPWARVHAHFYVKHLAWALTADAVLFRSGWWWRHVSAAPFTRIQVVAMHASPFDRRAHMARVRVDTAGAGAASHRIDIPYLPLEAANELYRQVAARAGRTAFEW
jgi:putative membrane protein